MLTTIKHIGNSNGLYIPKDFLNKLQLRTNDTVDLRIKEDTIVISKAKESDATVSAFRFLQSIRKQSQELNYRGELLEYLDERYLND